MKIFIDGDENMVSAGDQDSLGDILKELEAFLRKNGLSILEIKLDDNIIDRQKRLAFSSEQLGQFNELHITTAPTKMLCLDTIDELRKTFPELKKECEKVAIEIQAGNNDKALNIFRDLLKSWELIHNGIFNIIRLAQLDSSALKSNTTAIESLTQKSADRFGEINEAVNANDMVTVSDILEYEMSPLMDDWVNILDSVRDAINAKTDD